MLRRDKLVILGVDVGRRAHVKRFDGGALVRPSSRRFTLWVGVGMRPSDKGWSRPIKTRRDSLRTVFYWGPLELVVNRPHLGRMGRPTLYPHLANKRWTT